MANRHINLHYPWKVYSMAEKKPEGGVDSVDRALRILSCFTEYDDSLTLAELSTRTGYYKSTILRLSTSLERAGYMLRKSDKGFVLGPELMRLGVLYQRSLRLEDHVRPVLKRMREQTGESATFYRREGSSRICLFRNDPHRSLRAHVPEGSVLPLDRGAGGRVLLQFEAALSDRAELKRLLDRLPFVSYGEWEPELCSIAAPVFWAQPGMAGAVGISGLITHFSPERIQEMTVHLVAGARALSEALGGLHYWQETGG